LLLYTIYTNYNYNYCLLVYCIGNLYRHNLVYLPIKYIILFWNIHNDRVCWPIQPVGALRVPRNRPVNAGRAYTRIIVVADSRFRPPTAGRWYTGAPVQYKCDNWPWSIFCAKRTTVRPMRHVTCVYLIHLCRRSNNRVYRRHVTRRTLQATTADYELQAPNRTGIPI